MAAHSPHTLYVQERNVSWTETYARTQEYDLLNFHQSFFIFKVRKRSSLTLSTSSKSINYKFKLHLHNHQTSVVILFREKKFQTYFDSTKKNQFRLLENELSTNIYLNMPPPVIIHQTLLRHSTPDGGASRNQSWSPRELDQLERCQNLAKKMYASSLLSS